MAAPQAPGADAVVLFEKGMQAMQRHAYGPAADQFRALLERFPGERVVLDRTRVYLGLCERELARKPANPRTIEERLTAATAAVNNGQDIQAEGLVKSVLADEPNHDLGLYLMAVLEARRSRADQAMAYLLQAVTVSPEVRAQARHDTDFEALRGSEAFQALLDPPSSPAAPRRARRR